MSNETEMKTTEAGIIPVSWSVATLGDLLSVKHGFAFPGKHFADQGDYIVLTPGNFKEQGGFKEKSKEKYFLGDIPEDYLLAKDDLLIAMTEQMEGLLGSAIFVPSNNRYLHNQRLGLIEVTTPAKFSKDFAYYLFNSKSVRHQLSASASGTKIRHTAPGRVTEVVVGLPSLPEQKLIAKYLRDMDLQISNLSKQNHSLESFGRLLFKRWFVDFEFPNENGLPYKSNGGEMKDTELGPIPKGWNLGTLSDCMINFDSSRVPLSKMERAKKQGEYPYYGATSVMDYVDDFIFDGTYVLMGEDGSVMDERGYPYLQYVWGKIWVNNHAHVLQGSNGFTTEHLYLILSNTNVSHIVTGAVQPKINQGNLNSLKVIMSEINIRQLFADKIAPLFKKIKGNHEQIQTLSKLRDTLLPKLMSGKIRVPIQEVSA